MRALCAVLLIAAVAATASGAGVDVTEASVMPDPESRDIPQTIWFQGFVEDTGSGEPVDATYDIVAEIFDADVDGTSLWGPETHAATVIVGGWFNIELGATVDLPTFGSPPYHLELTINSEVLLPRQKLGSVPASFRSARTDDTDDDWYYSGGNIYRMSGNIGVGTMTPERDLDVAGTVRTDAFEMVPGAVSGHVLTSDGGGVGTWQSPPSGGGLDLPYSGSTSHAASAFSVDNTNSGTSAAAINGKHTLAGNYGRLGTGTAGVLGSAGTGWAGQFDGPVYVDERLGVGLDPSEGRFGVIAGATHRSAIYASQVSTEGAYHGVHAYANSSEGAGVHGISTADSSGMGVYGVSFSADGVGVRGDSPSRAVMGINTSTMATGVLGSGSVGVLGDGATSGWAGYFTNGNVHMTGRVGIGTTIPQNALHIRYDSPGEGGIWIENHDTSAGSRAGVFLGDEDGMAAGLVIYDEANSVYPSAMRLYNHKPDGGLIVEIAGTEAARIGTNGNVGIGTDLPEHKLNVVSHGGTAIYGRADVADDYAHYGVYGETESLDGWGVFGKSRLVGVGGYNPDSGTYGRLAYVDKGVWGWAGQDYQWAGYFEGNVGVDGRLGIGTVSPQSALDVDGLARIRKDTWPASDTGKSMELAYSQANHRGYVQVYDRTSGGLGWGQLFLGDGPVGIGVTTDYSHELDVAGDIQCVALHETSDDRYKSDVRELTDALDAVARLRGVSFEWNAEAASAGATPGKRGIGVIAQEVEEVFPELVSAPDGAPMAVDYSKLTAVLIQAVKELRTENEDLSARLAALEAAAR